MERLNMIATLSHIYATALYTNVPHPIALTSTDTVPSSYRLYHMGPEPFLFLQFSCLCPIVDSTRMLL